MVRLSFVPGGQGRVGGSTDYEDSTDGGGPIQSAPIYEICGKNKASGRCPNTISKHALCRTGLGWPMSSGHGGRDDLRHEVQAEDECRSGMESSCPPWLPDMYMFGVHQVKRIIGSTAPAGA